MQLPENTEELLRMIFAEQAKHEKAQKLERFKHLNPYAKPNQIVFAGSSLMEQFPINEMMMGENIPLEIYNRGVGGFTISEMQEAIQECVYDLKPAHVFINIGTNDLNDEIFDKTAFIERYRSILLDIKKHLPDVKIYVMSYYPVNRMVGENSFGMWELLKNRTNERILSANKAVEALAESLGIKYLNVNAGLCDEAGELKAEFAIDGMHMYANGYREVLKELLPILQSLS